MQENGSIAQITAEVRNVCLKSVIISNEIVPR